jgi:hypothetical protein
MLPETLAPAAEILPSVTVRVELAVGSQLPLFVVPDSIERLLGEGGRASGRREGEGEKNSANADRTHEPNPQLICDDRLICIKYVQNLPRCHILNYSNNSKYLLEGRNRHYGDLKAVWALR